MKAIRWMDICARSSGLAAERAEQLLGRMAWHSPGVSPVLLARKPLQGRVTSLQSSLPSSQACNRASLLKWQMQPFFCFVFGYSLVLVCSMAEEPVPCNV